MPLAAWLVQCFQWKGVQAMINSLHVASDEAPTLANILYSSQTGAIDPLAVFHQWRGGGATVANGGQGHDAPFRRSHLFPNGKMVFQSFFMSTTVQPFAWASSSALSRWPILELRS